MLEIPVAAEESNNDASQTDALYDVDDFWTPSPKKRLLVIAIPFRKGRHVAERPKDFLPIIAHLQKLHLAGYVHGDIRAYNTVFQENGMGFLIDFDFSGKVGKAFYPKGYNALLDDGFRIGEGGKEIEKWQDWYALGQLIFNVHEVLKPEAEDELQLWFLFLDCKHFWTTLRTDPSEPKICELKELLSNEKVNGWTIQPGGHFEDCLNKSDPPVPRTKKGATGSPPKVTPP